MQCMFRNLAGFLDGLRAIVRGKGQIGRQADKSVKQFESRRLPRGIVFGRCLLDATISGNYVGRLKRLSRFDGCQCDFDISRTEEEAVV